MSVADEVTWTIAGSLTVVPASTRTDLLAEPVAKALAALADPDAVGVGVAEIDPTLADTAAFCEAYGSPTDGSANCVIVAGRRGETTRYAACLVLASTRADVNGLVRKRLDARKASFAPMDDAVALTGMEYGGICPVGLPEDWPILVDAAVAACPAIVIGSGVRHSKLALPGSLAARLPAAEVTDHLAH